MAITNPLSIVAEANDFVNQTNQSLSELSQSCLAFITVYDQYITDNIKDASLLKNKMKDIVIRTVDNAEL